MRRSEFRFTERNGNKCANGKKETADDFPFGNKVQKREDRKETENSNWLEVGNINLERRKCEQTLALLLVEGAKCI